MSAPYGLWRCSSFAILILLCTDYPVSNIDVIHVWTVYFRKYWLYLSCDEIIDLFLVQVLDHRDGEVPNSIEKFLYHFVGNSMWWKLPWAFGCSSMWYLQYCLRYIISGYFFVPVPVTCYWTVNEKHWTRKNNVNVNTEPLSLKMYSV
jgi:hypothetical protein